MSFYSTAISQEQLYRNEEHNFRIKFPKDWQIKDGDGPNVVKKAVSSGSSIIILVKKIITPETINSIRQESQEYSRLSDKEITDLLKDELDFNNYSDSEILELAESQVAELKQKFEDIRILEKSISYLDNKKFAYVKYSMSYRVQNIHARAIAIMYMTTHLGKYYQISGSSEAIKFNDLESTFIRSISTFVFEDYNTSSKNMEDKKEDFDPIDFYFEREFPNKQTPSLYFLFAVVFLITPSLSVLLRFLIFKEALTEKKAIVISISLFLTALFFWIYLVKQADIFLFILALVVGLNYLILRHSPKIQIDSQNGFQGSQREKTDKQNEHHKEESEKHDEEEYDINDYEEIEDSHLTTEEKEKLYAKLLGLSGKLTKKDISKIYRSLIDKYHPDKVSHLGEEFQKFSHKKTKDINKAYSFFKKKYNL
jgi:hypothetical protein